MRLPLSVSTIVSTTVLTLIASVPAHAELSDYIAARTKFPPRAGLTLSAVQANPAKYDHAVFEVKGVVSGISRSDTGSNLLLRSDSNVALIRGSSDAPLPNSGEYARALVTLENGDLNLLSVITEAEIGDRVLDPKPAPKPAAKKTAKRSVKSPSIGRVAKLPVRWPVAQYGRSSVASRGIVDPRIAELYKEVVHGFNPRLSEAQAKLISQNIVDSSYNLGVDARFIMAIFATESGFKIKARSRTGAMGLGQLMPGTARSLGVSNAYDPEQNIWGAVKLLQKHWLTYSQQTNDFGQVIALVCAAYNAGPGAVKKYGGVPPYRETQNYVKKVAAWYAFFAPELFK